MPTTAYLQTKNEVVETDIVVPEIEEVGADEVLERVGEVMIIVDNKTVIVKGAPAEVLVRASDHALDCDTLLVFEDRKVLGYVRFFFFLCSRIHLCYRSTKRSGPHLSRCIR